MKSLFSVPDHVLLRDLAALVARDHLTTAEMLAYLGEVDARRLYLPAACDSMHTWCVRVLHLSEDCAEKRLQAARTARKFPLLLDALAAGRLHLTAINLLAPYLTEANAAELVTAATQRSCAEIRRALAERFPRPDVPTSVRPLAGPAVAPAGLQLSNTANSQGISPDSNQVNNTLVFAAAAPAPRARMLPLSAERCELRTTLDAATERKLRLAQDLLGHAAPGCDLDRVIDRAVDLLLEKLLRSRLRAGKVNGVHVSAEIKAFVFLRDQGRCTFVDEHGHTCGSCKRIEIDHIVAVADGGSSTPENLRLLCRRHNRYAAEQRFGKAFIEGKIERAQRDQAIAKAAREREAARLAQAVGGTTADARTAASENATPPGAERLAEAPLVAASEPERAAASVAEQAAAAAAREAERAQRRREVQCGLESLRMPSAQAKRLAATADTELPIEECLRAILRTLSPPGVRRIAPGGAAA